MNSEQAREIIRKAVERAGSQIAFAKLHNLSPAYVSDTLKGVEPSEKILAAVGLERAPPAYRRKMVEKDQANG